MAVETKIGLVVGLGFITCFAVVLSHRGSGDQLSARMAYDLLSKQNVDASPKPIPPVETFTRRQARERQGRDTASDRRKNVRSAQGRDNRPGAKQKRVSGAKQRAGKRTGARRNLTADATTAPSRRRRATLPKGERDRKIAGSQRRASVKDSSAKGLPSFEALFGGAAVEREDRDTDAKRQAEPKTARRAAARRATENSASTKKRPTKAGRMKRSLNPRTTGRPRIALGVGDGAEKLKNPNQAVSAKQVATGRVTKSKSAAGADVKTDRKPKAPTRYVVRPRDTLWRISERMYGVGSRKIVDAIVAANKDRLTSAEKLRIGVELVLPAIDGVGAAKLDGRQRPKRTSKLGSAPGGARYYQIQNGDRYSTIAERFLGSKSRWKEIHEMNKDIFPDPGKIRYGVRIRLPSSALLASAS